MKTRLDITIDIGMCECCTYPLYQCLTDLTEDHFEAMGVTTWDAFWMMVEDRIDRATMLKLGPDK